MSPTYEQNKKHIYNWRLKNVEQFSEYKKKYYDANRAKISKRSADLYRYKKEAEIFRSILLDENL
jgi:hypothetical protein